MVEGSLDPCTRVQNPNSISIDLPFCRAQGRDQHRQTDRQADRPPYNVYSNRPPLVLRIAIWPKKRQRAIRENNVFSCEYCFKFKYCFFFMQLWRILFIYSKRRFVFVVFSVARGGFFRCYDKRTIKSHEYSSGATRRIVVPR